MQNTDPNTDSYVNVWIGGVNGVPGDGGKAHSIVIGYQGPAAPRT